MKCVYCEANAWYRCADTDDALCPAHARMAVVSAGERTPGHTPGVRPATPADQPAIEALARHFWAETDVACFGQCYDVLALPAFLAEDAGQALGCLVYAVEGDTMTLVLLNVLPSHQKRGAGAGLLQAAVAEARARGLTAIRVATTNDDLPALVFYQRHGFRLAGLCPGLVAEHHGAELPGFGGLPVCDELQLCLPIR